MSTHGYISGKLINQDPELPHEWVFRDRFGSLLNAYQLVGWTLTRGQLNRLGKVAKLGERELIREAVEAAKSACSLVDAP